AAPRARLRSRLPAHLRPLPWIGRGVAGDEAAPAGPRPAQEPRPGIARAPAAPRADGPGGGRSRPAPAGRRVRHLRVAADRVRPARHHHHGPGHPGGLQPARDPAAITVPVVAHFLMVNLPNLLTLSRLAAIPLLMALLLVRFPGHDQLAAALFVV